MNLLQAEPPASNLGDKHAERNQDTLDADCAHRLITARAPSFAGPPGTTWRNRNYTGITNHALALTTMQFQNRGAALKARPVPATFDQA